MRRKLLLALITYNFIGFAFIISSSIEMIGKLQNILLLINNGGRLQNSYYSSLYILVTISNTTYKLIDIPFIIALVSLVINIVDVVIIAITDVRKRT